MISLKNVAEQTLFGHACPENAPHHRRAGWYSNERELLFSGDPGCSSQTLKRLMIIGEELAFMDRPSVTIGGWTMIGSGSPLRQFEGAMQDTQPSLRVYTPPVGPISSLHEEYVRRDLANPAFREAFLRGLRTSDDFAFKFLQLKADYGPPAGTPQTESRLELSAPRCGDVDGHLQRCPCDLRIADTCEPW
jgi:hypothetical protein